MNEDAINKLKKHNVTLFPYYKMIAWDLLFFYAFSFLFLTTVKGLRSADIIFVESIYIFFKFILQIWGAAIADKLGNRKSLILANSFIFLYILFIILAPNIQIVILARFFCAFGFVIKGICEHNILYSSIADSDDRIKIFAKVDGRSSGFHYILESISSVVGGFLFAINPYFPMYLCLTFCVISVLLSYQFKEIPKGASSSKFSFTSIKKYGRDLRLSFRDILKSNRLRSLILFCGVFSALIGVLSSLRISLLHDISFPPQYIGLAFATLTLFSAVSSFKQNWFHDRFRNKLLGNFASATVVSILVSGLLIILNFPRWFASVVILFMFSIQFITKGSFYTLSKKYLSSFTTSSIRNRIYSANNLFEAIAGMTTSFIVSRLLLVANTAYTLVILGCIFALLFLSILHYMKPRVGLKPEQYSRSDIPTEVH